MSFDMLASSTSWLMSVLRVVEICYAANFWSFFFQVQSSWSKVVKLQSRECWQITNLVGGFNPLKNISQWEGLFHILWKSTRIFQTTNQQLSGKSQQKIKSSVPCAWASVDALPSVVAGSKSMSCWCEKPRSSETIHFQWSWVDDGWSVWSSVRQHLFRKIHKCRLDRLISHLGMVQFLPPNVFV